jgi:amino acid transporter
MKKTIAKFGAWAATLPILLSGSTAFAVELDPAVNLKSVGKGLGQETAAPLPEMLGNIIEVFLSVLGIIFVVLVVYAGYLYLTAAGDDEKVKKAKKLLGQAVIGLIIVLSAYAIALFVLGSLSEISKE